MSCFVMCWGKANANASVLYECVISDPEEFLTVIMQHILALEPLLKLYIQSTAASFFHV